MSSLGFKIMPADLPGMEPQATGQIRCIGTVVNQLDILRIAASDQLLNQRFAALTGRLSGNR